MWWRRCETACVGPLQPNSNSTYESKVFARGTPIQGVVPVDFILLVSWHYEIEKFSNIVFDPHPVGGPVIQLSRSSFWHNCTFLSAACTETMTELQSSQTGGAIWSPTVKTTHLQARAALEVSRCWFLGYWHLPPIPHIQPHTIRALLPR